MELFFDKASEDYFTNHFIVPLFEEMGFKQIISKGHVEKINEFGQDIKLMKFKVPSEHYLYFVAQIKKGTIGASAKQPTKEIEGILSEIRPAFNKNIFDPEISREVKPDHVYLITSGRIGEQAKNYLYEQIDTDFKRNLLLLERKQLIDLFFKNSLSLLDQEEIKEYLKDEI